MVGILAEKIHDNRFLRLIANMLKAGYLGFRSYAASVSRARRRAWISVGVRWSG
jgi:hypothetical protein